MKNLFILFFILFNSFIYSQELTFKKVSDSIIIESQDLLDTIFITVSFVFTQDIGETWENPPKSSYSYVFSKFKNFNLQIDNRLVGRGYYVIGYTTSIINKRKRIKINI